MPPAKTASNQPAARRPAIGVFDSGVGGLTVLKELLRLVPGADYLYFGDTARLPYGSKSVDTVARYAVSAAHFLQKHHIDLLVVACNTATALAFDQIRQAIPMPAIGVVAPGADAAARASRNRRVVVLATEATIASHAYQRALAERKIATQEKPCPLFVPLVEEGWIEHPVTEQVARIYLDSVFNSQTQAADVLLLGCTHYPLLRPLLERLVPAGVSIVDSAESTAQAVRTHFQSLHLPAAGEGPYLRFFATDSVEKFRRLGERFLGRAIENVQHVDVEV